MYAIGCIAYELMIGHLPLITSDKNELREFLFENQIKLGKA